MDCSEAAKRFAEDVKNHLERFTYDVTFQPGEEEALGLVYRED